MAALLCAVVLLTLTVEPVQATRTAPEAEQPSSEAASALPDAEQPESGRTEHSENIGWEIRTDKDGDATKWFLVDSPSGDTSVLLHPDGSSEVLYGEAYIMLYDEDSGQTYAIGPVSPEGYAP